MRCFIRWKIFDRLRRITTVTSFKLFSIVYFLTFTRIFYILCIGLALKFPIRNLCIIQHNKKKNRKTFLHTTQSIHTYFMIPSKFLNYLVYYITSSISCVNFLYDFSSCIIFFRFFSFLFVAWISFILLTLLPLQSPLYTF